MSLVEKVEFTKYITVLLFRFPGPGVCILILNKPGSSVLISKNSVVILKYNTAALCIHSWTDMCFFGETSWSEYNMKMSYNSKYY